MKNFHARLELLLDEKAGGNKAEFSRLTGISAHAFGHVLNRRHLPKVDMIYKILMAFPDVDARWLITGKRAKV